MPTLNPFIHFNGNAAEAFNFYRTVLGGEFTRLLHFKDIPGNPFPDEANKILQIILTVENSYVLMGSDVPDVLGQVNVNENRSKIMLRADSKEEANTIFQGLSEGGVVEMPMSEDSPWGSYFGMFRDQYGIEWMIEYTSI